MKRLVEFTSQGGAPILVEVEDVGSADEIQRGLPPTAFIERAHDSFESALEQARPMIYGLVNHLQLLRKDAGYAPPDEVQVEFGIIMSAEAGAILAAASSTANYKVTMTWKQTSG